MTVYTVENTSKAGMPCKVFDSMGNEIPYVVRCDTETGVIERAHHINGRLVVGPTGDTIARIVETYPLPLQVICEKTNEVMP